MNLTTLCQRVDSDIEFAGDAKITEAEWAALRRHLAASNTRTLAAMLRKMHDELRHYTYQRSNREMLAECATILKDYE